MTDKRHILLATDMSETAAHAYDPVTDLARRLEARITLLLIVHDHVYVAGPIGAPVPAAMDSNEAAKLAGERLQTLRGSFPDDLAVDVDTAIGNEVGLAIVDYADRHDADYIAMATHGRSGLRRLVLGSVAESVLRRSRIPLLLFPTGTED